MPKFVAELRVEAGSSQLSGSRGSSATSADIDPGTQTGAGAERFGGRIDADPITQATVNLELIAAQHAVALARPTDRLWCRNRRSTATACRSAAII
jgi:hypothetical protein